MAVHSQTMAQRARVSVKVNNGPFDWFDHICRWLGTFFHATPHFQPPGVYGTWDARREQYHELKAEAAIDLVAAQKGGTWSSQIYGMSL